MRGRLFFVAHGTSNFKPRRAKSFIFLFSMSRYLQPRFGIFCFFRNFPVGKENEL